MELVSYRLQFICSCGWQAMQMWLAIRNKVIVMYDIPRIRVHLVHGSARAVVGFVEAKILLFDITVRVKVESIFRFVTKA